MTKLEDIHPGNPLITSTCKNAFNLTYSTPTWDSGAPAGCSGSVYRIEYTVTDPCGNKAFCIQRFTLKLPEIKIDCPKDLTVKCKDDIIHQPHSSWLTGLSIETKIAGPTLISGRTDCSGSIYEVIYTYIINCTDTVVCKQKFTIQNNGPTILCPPDQILTSLADAYDQNYTVRADCNLPYRVIKTGPELIDGVRGEPGSSYYVIYTVIDSCHRSARCTSKLSLVGFDKDPHKPCNYPAEWFGSPTQIVQDRQDRFQQDIARYLNEKTCAWLEALSLHGVTEFYSDWASEEILGSQIGIANDIARRGNIQIVLSKVDDIKLAIEAIEAALYGDADELKDILVPEMLTRMATYLSGSGTPAAVITTLKELGALAKYLDEEILLNNLNTYTDWARRDPMFFHADHFLITYARINDLKNSNQETWQRLKIHQTLVSYSQYKLNATIQIPVAKEIWNSQENLNAVRTVTRAMLNEVCVLLQEKIRLRNHLQQLKQEQSLLIRFQSVWNYFKQFRCPPCADILNVSIVQTSPGVFDCQCNPPFKWSPDRSACVSVESCTLANTTQIFWNNKYICDCITGFKWNTTRTQCSRVIPDCNSRLANSEAIWNDQVNDYECRCIQGYQYNVSTGLCEVKPPQCQDQNATPVWNSRVNAYECQCVAGYEYDFTSNQCVIKPPQCQDIHATPVWNGNVNAYECQCIQGYQYNFDTKRCELPLPDCSALYPNTEVVWDPVKKQYVCNCLKGFTWNPAGNGCIKKEPVNPIGVISSIVDVFINGGSTGTANPTVKPENQKTGNCNQQYGSGSNEPEQYTFELGRNLGTVEFKYETYQAKDRIHIYQGFSKVFDSGCIGTNGWTSRIINLNGSGSQLRVVVDPLCDPSDHNTQWNFSLGCPN